MVEQRKYKRFEIVNCAFALLRSSPVELSRIKKMGMGEIAVAVFRSNPAKLGPIIDISMGGLAFRYLKSHKPSDKSLELDILVASCGFYLSDVPFIPISDFEVAGQVSGGPQKEKQASVQFDGLTHHQISQLDYFIQNFSIHQQIKTPSKLAWITKTIKKAQQKRKTGHFPNNRLY